MDLPLAEIGALLASGAVGVGATWAALRKKKTPGQEAETAMLVGQKPLEEIEAGPDLASAVHRAWGLQPAWEARVHSETGLRYAPEQRRRAVYITAVAHLASQNWFLSDEDKSKLMALVVEQETP